MGFYILHFLIRPQEGNKELMPGVMLYTNCLAGFLTCNKGCIIILQWIAVDPYQGPPPPVWNSGYFQLFKSIKMTQYMKQDCNQLLISLSIKHRVYKIWENSEKCLFHYSINPRLHFELTYFIWPTVQILKIFSLQRYKTEKSWKYLQEISWKWVMFGIFHLND